jgi:hypothetical protein
MKDETIKGQRVNLERLQQHLGDDLKTAQFGAALFEQNYDRASKIAHSEGPYLSPDKDDHSVIKAEPARTTPFQLD